MLYIPRHYLSQTEIDRYDYLLEEDRKFAAEAFAVQPGGLWALASDEYNEKAAAGWAECEALRDLAFSRECDALCEWWQNVRGLPVADHYLVDMRPEVQICWGDYDLSYEDVVLQARQILLEKIPSISPDDVVAICSESFPNMSLCVIMPVEAAFFTRMLLDRQVVALTECHRALKAFHE